MSKYGMTQENAELFGMMYEGIKQVTSGTFKVTRAVIIIATPSPIRRATR